MPARGELLLRNAVTVTLAAGFPAVSRTTPVTGPSSADVPAPVAGVLCPFWVSVLATWPGSSSWQADSRVTNKIVAILHPAGTRCLKTPVSPVAVHQMANTRSARYRHGK
jgi:hypothetical protein